MRMLICTGGVAMKTMRYRKTWMAWLIVLSLVLGAGPAVFVETAVSAAEQTSVPEGGAVKISAKQYSKGTFTVRFSGLKNASQASGVRFKVWSKSDQGDVKWYDAVRQSDGSYTRVISIRNHNYAGTYKAEVYVTDKKGVSRKHTQTTCNMKASAKITVKYMKKGRYRATVKSIKYPGISSFKKLRLPTWSQKNGKDDIVWHRPTGVNGKTYYIDFNIKEHKHLGKFTSNLYVYDSTGKRYYVCAKNFSIAKPKNGKVTITSVNVNDGVFTAKMTGIKNKSRMKKVRFKVWSTGQNVKWYTAKKKSNGSYTAKIKIANHGNNRGTYNIYGYAVDTKGDYRYQSKATRSMALPKTTTRTTPILYASKLKAYNSSAQSLAIDVSHWQGKIDWTKVKKDGIQAAIVRTSYSAKTVTSKAVDDRQWENNIKGCKANGIPYGVYIYSLATTPAQVEKEAQHVLDMMKDVSANPKYPVFLDLEDAKQNKLSQAQLKNIYDAWAKKIKAGGYTPGVYASKSWWNNQLATLVIQSGYTRWVAQWPYTYTSTTRCSFTKAKVNIWQFSDNGRVNGISGAVDLNWIYH